VIIALTILTVMHAQAFSDSVALWSDVVKKNPTSWMAHNNLGNSLLGDAQSLTPDRADEANQMLDSAAGHFAKAVELRPSHDRAWANWGRLLVIRQRPSEALEKLDRALTLNPNHIDALIDRGRALLDLKRVPEARAAFEQVLSAAAAQPTLPSKLAATHEFLAKIAQQQGDVAAALEHYRKAAEATPRDPSIQYAYGKSLVEQGKLNEAAVALATAVALRPEDLDAQTDLALLFLKTGNHRGAFTRLREIGEVTDGLQKMGVPVSKDQTERILAAGRIWRRQYEASTRPSTTQSATERATAATTATQPTTNPIDDAEITRLLLRPRVATTQPTTTAPATQSTRQLQSARS
jgi:tetratricopeptide (TPR) repeat protein